jgi:hypothetical protein
VSAFVQGYRGELLVCPGGAGSEVDGAWVEGAAAVVVCVEQSLSTGSLLESVVDQVAAERVGDRDAAFAGSAFGCDEAGDAVPASFDVDQVLFEVDLVPVEGLQLAEA